MQPWPALVERAIAAMPVAALLGFRFTRLDAEGAETELALRHDLTFDGRQAQASVLAALADFTAGAAVTAAAPPGSLFSTVDMSVKLLAPAAGGMLIARAAKLGGRALAVGRADVFARQDGAETLCATALITMRLKKAD